MPLYRALPVANPLATTISLLQVVTGTFPYGQQLVKYGYKENAECTLCKKAHEESGSSWKGEPKETICHIQNVGCLGQKEVGYTLGSRTVNTVLL
jgi:hypothetical protein